MIIHLPTKLELTPPKSHLLFGQPNSARNQRTFTVSMYSYWYQALFYIVLTKFYYQTGLYGLW